jgi:serine/threonine protein kinase
MAEVWRANAVFDNGDSYPVAIKRVIPSMQDPRFRAMFRDEARLGMLLRHPNIVRVYDARDIDGTYIMIMELVDGESLRSMTGRAGGGSEPVPVPLAFRIMHQVALGLSYAHRATDARGRPLGIVHRDVSPQNVLLGTNGAVKIADFGLADAAVHRHVRSEDVVGGKLAYLAPEVVRGGKVDLRCDLFALGVVLWEVVSGRRLFVGDNEAQTITNIMRCEVPRLRDEQPDAEALDAIIGRLVTLSPDERFRNARTLVAELERLMHAHGWTVGAPEVAAAVQQSRSTRLGAASDAVARLLTEELDKFAELTASSLSDVGAEPLDPSRF